jgi:nucleoid-associated protein YgaU
MEFSSISNKIKDKLNQGADKFLSSKIKEELGFNKPTLDSLYNLSENQNLEDNLNSFYKPVNSTFLSQRQYKKIQNWAIVLIAVISVLLIMLFISMVVPQQNFKNNFDGAQIFVKGSKVTNPEDKIAEAKLEDESSKTRDEKASLEVKDINVASVEATEALASSSPLLKNPELELSKYKIQSGDTLEKIALRFYGSSAPKDIDKIKIANKIRNVRLIRIGQEILIPMS